MVPTPPAALPEGGRSTNSPGPQFEGLNDRARVQSSYNLVISSTRGARPQRAARHRQTCRIRWKRWVDGKFVTLRIPYPMGFHAKGLDAASTNPMRLEGRDLVD